MKYCGVIYIYIFYLYYNLNHIYILVIYLTIHNIYSNIKHNILCAKSTYKYKILSL